MFIFITIDEEGTKLTYFDCNYEKANWNLCSPCVNSEACNHIHSNPHNVDFNDFEIFKAHMCDSSSLHSRAITSISYIVTYHRIERHTFKRIHSQRRMGICEMVTISHSQYIYIYNIYIRTPFATVCALCIFIRLPQL